METQTKIAKHFNQDVSYFLQKTRKPEILFIRQLMAYYMRKNDKMSLQEIANELGYNTTAAILNCIKHVNEIIDTKDKEFYPIYSSVNEIFEIKSIYELVEQASNY